jgi:predicted transcriptional regulator of viral defense system
MKGRKHRKLDILRSLRSYPLFMMNDFVRLTGMEPEYARLYMHRLAKEGSVFQVERGKYTALDDPMAFSSHIEVPSYLSFWTAIRLYNLTEQLPKDIMVACPRWRRPIEFRGTRIRFFRMRHMWGYGKQRYTDFDIFVADKEKCVIDSLLLGNVPLGEVAKVIKGSDEKRLVEYAIRAGSKSLMKRLGYMIEASGMAAERLTNRLDNNYVYLDTNAPKKGEKSKKWRLIINRRLDDIY